MNKLVLLLLIMLALPSCKSAKEERCERYLDTHHEKDLALNRLKTALNNLDKNENPYKSIELMETIRDIQREQAKREIAIIEEGCNE